MQLDLTTKQYRRLLDMAYIGNWILNSTRGDDRFKDYDEVESLLFSKAKELGMDIITVFAAMLRDKSAEEMTRYFH